MQDKRNTLGIISTVLLLAAAACATAPQLLPHDPEPTANLDPKTCPVIAIAGALPVQFPAKAMEIGQEGWVHLRFDIDADGIATNIVQLGSSPPGVFDAAARETLVKARFLTAQQQRCEFVLGYHKDPSK